MSAPHADPGGEYQPPTQREHRCSECPYCGPPKLIQGGACPRCGAARTPDGFCSACFQRGLG